MVLQVVFTGVVRKMSECFFTKKELMYIDDLLPGTSLDDHKKTDKSVNRCSHFLFKIPFRSGLRSSKVHHRYLTIFIIFFFFFCGGGGWVCTDEVRPVGDAVLY